MRTCGECAWYEDKPTRECATPTPMWLRKGGWYVGPDEDATTCRCFMQRVYDIDCRQCDGAGFVFPLVNGKVGDRIPCPACQGNNAACRGKEEK
jgi:hypothetical protein